jgi:hypothetical protein
MAIMKHLTEHEIQSYVEGTLKDQGDMESHLRLCRYCQDQLALYQAVWSQLRTDIGISFSPHFAEGIIARIEAAQERKTNLIESGLLAAAILVGIGLTWYYMDLGPMMEFVADAYRNAFDYFRDYSFLPHIPSTWLGANTSLLFFAGAALIFAGFADSFLSRRKFLLK